LLIAAEDEQKSGGGYFQAGTDPESIKACAQFPLFGPLLSPLALAMSKSFPAKARALGYHSVGTKPMGNSMTATSDVSSTGLVSNTTTALSDATAA